MLAILAVGFAGILVRLFVLQVKDAAALQRMAIDQRIRSVTLPAPRGTIFDRNGRELAMSLPADDVYVDPQLVRNAAAEAPTVASILGLKEAAVLQLLSTKATAGGQPVHFAWVKMGVDLQTARLLASHDLAGIGMLSDTRRYYPNGPLAPQVLGVVGVDGAGLAGLELQYQSLLAGKPGHEVVQEDPSGTLIPQAGATHTAPVPGDDLVLTIDRDIQYRAQQSLAEAVQRNHARSGTVIVMNPHTGAILAMATYPWFDPNNVAASNPATITNSAVTDVYEPGSVNKIVTAAAALQEGVLNLNTRFMVPDQVTVYGDVIHDAEIHPTEPMTLADILAYSSNIGAIKVAALLGERRFFNYLQAFGYGRPTGIDFPGESPGILPPLSQWSGTSMATIPFGQGIAVTPLQMACVYATIANGGVWVQPRLVRGTIGPDGQFQPAPAPATRRVVSERTARTVAELLAYGVDVGTGVQAQIPGFWVAGKTGTAQIPNPKGGGYLPNVYDASFMGFTPASNPQIVVVAILDRPSTVYGGVAAAPLFRDVARFALAHLRIPPASKPPIPPHAIPAG